jgi:hypothetical protein
VSHFGKRTKKRDEEFFMRKAGSQERKTDERSVK